MCAIIPLLITDIICVCVYIYIYILIFFFFSLSLSLHSLSISLCICLSSPHSFCFFQCIFLPFSSLTECPPTLSVSLCWSVLGHVSQTLPVESLQVLVIIVDMGSQTFAEHCHAHFQTLYFPNCVWVCCLFFIVFDINATWTHHCEVNIMSWCDFVAALHILWGTFSVVVIDLLSNRVRVCIPINRKVPITSFGGPRWVSRCQETEGNMKNLGEERQRNRRRQNAETWKAPTF